MEDWSIEEVVELCKLIGSSNKYLSRLKNMEELE